MTKSKEKRRQKRKIKVRSRILGTLKKPRLSVFRANKFIYAQIINDQKGQTLVAASEKDLISKQKTKSKNDSKTKSDRAKEVGRAIAQKALKIGIKKVVFDRGPFKYHGRVKALAEAARKDGLKF